MFLLILAIRDLKKKFIGVPRLPWISTKTPPWDEAGAGLHDEGIDRLLAELDSYGKQVWLPFHHEPEGGGGINSPDDPSGAAGWRSMQSRVRQRMDALETQNIAFAPILMAFTWHSSFGRTPDDWWVPDIWDFYGIDHYRDDESGDMFTSPSINAFNASIAIPRA